MTQASAGPFSRWLAGNAVDLFIPYSLEIPQPLSPFANITVTFFGPS
jgi:hypothetical protein